VQPPSCETIVSSGDVQRAVPLPISLTVGSESFPVVAIVPEEAGWTHPSGYPGAAAWVCGTVVNYVVGLEPVPENETLLGGMRPGDEIKMHLSNGVDLVFRFVEQREVAANEAGVFEQMRPRLTLILEREIGTWQIAVADYVAETEPVEPPSETLVQLGQPVRAGDAQVTAIRGYAEPSEPDLLPGTMSAGMSDLRMAAPLLPWTVQPGQTQVIELQYPKPDAPAALLTLLGYSFEIQGLR